MKNIRFFYLKPGMDFAWCVEQPINMTSPLHQRRITSSSNLSDLNEQKAAPSSLKTFRLRYSRNHASSITHYPLLNISCIQCQSLCFTKLVAVDYNIAKAYSNPTQTLVIVNDILHKIKQTKMLTQTSLKKKKKKKRKKTKKKKKEALW